MFADLRFIDTIDLAENQIAEIQREAFKNMFMTRINISHNVVGETRIYHPFVLVTISAFSFV